jgi:hypothetical protein
MGNSFSTSPTNPLSKNESGTPPDINQSISNLNKLIRTLQSDNTRYGKDLLIKQGQAIDYVKRNNMEAAKIVAKQVVRYNTIIKKNLTTIGQLQALIKKLQETKNAVQLRQLVNQANSVEVSEQNPLFRGGEYMEKLIKYEDKMLGLTLN